MKRNFLIRTYLTKVTILLYATNLLVLGTLEKKSFVLSPSMARMGGRAPPKNPLGPPQPIRTLLTSPYARDACALPSFVADICLWKFSLKIFLKSFILTVLNLISFWKFTKGFPFVYRQLEFIKMLDIFYIYGDSFDFKVTRVVFSPSFGTQKMVHLLALPSG